MLLSFSEWMVFKVMGFVPESRLGQALSFFVYDSLKILFLLLVFIFVIGVIRTYLPRRAIHRWMSGKNFAGYAFAALFGAVTPFCSCSSIPLFFSFVKAGIPLGVSFAFLVTSPLINEYLVVLMAGFFGWKIAVVYVLSGLTVGVVSGLLVGRMGMERYLERDFMQDSNDPESAEVFVSFRSRLLFGWREAVDIVQKVWLWVLVGVALGAVIHNYVPSEMIQGLIARTGPFSVVIAVALGVPMYGSCAAIVPVAVVLFQKGIPLGTALAFMMAVSALSLPEAVMLRRVMKLPLILLFFMFTALAMMVIGYLLNFLQPVLV